MKNSILFIAWSMLLLSACSSTKELSVTITSLPLNRDSVTFYKAWTIYEGNNGIYFLSMKNNENAVTLYKESSKGFNLYKTLVFPQTYIDTMGDEMNSDKFQLVPINLDSLIIFTRHTISLLDMRNSCLLKHFSYNHDSEVVIIVDRCGPLRWNATRKVLPVMVVRFDKKDETWDWDSEMAAEFSLETGKLNILPIKYPRERSYTNHILSNFYSDPLITCNNEKYIVGFQGTPTVFTYNSGKNRTDSFRIENPLFRPFPAYYDTLKLKGDAAFLKQMVNSATYDFSFSELIYDSHMDLYYRFFKCEMPEKNSEGKKNELSDGQIGFSVIDNKFQVIGDACWNIKEASSSSWYATSKGIYGFTHGYVGKKCSNNHKGNIIRINWEKE